MRFEFIYPFISIHPFYVRGLFRIQSNIYGEAFLLKAANYFAKKAPS